MIFDGSGALLESDANLRGVIVVPPSGTFDYAKLHGEDRFTWQPEAGVRFAAVLKYYGGTRPGFVLSARSLREVEIRESNSLFLVGFGWLVSVVLFFLKYFFEKIIKRSDE